MANNAMSRATSARQEAGDAGSLAASASGRASSAQSTADQALTAANAAAAQIQAFVSNFSEKNIVHNRLHNADFTQLVAQPGISQKHGRTNETATVFAADRWELADGTVSAQAHENGNGYHSFVLNGTIQQVVECPPDNPAYGIYMISGSAETIYADGVFTIVSEGGVIGLPYLYESTEIEDTQEPLIVRRGYAAELHDCMRFYLHLASASEISFPGYAFNSTQARFTLPLPVPMRLENPTISVTYRSNVHIFPKDIVPSAINSAKVVGHTCGVTMTGSGFTPNDVLVVKPNAYIELIADL